MSGRNNDVWTGAPRFANNACASSLAAAQKAGEQEFSSINFRAFDSVWSMASETMSDGDQFFEGVEKLLEIWFPILDERETASDLRKIPRLVDFFFEGRSDCDRYVELGRPIPRSDRPPTRHQLIFICFIFKFALWIDVCRF